MEDNYSIIGQGFNVLLQGLAPYIARELEVEYGNNWWQDAVMTKLYEDQKRDLPYQGTWAELVDSLDIQRCLLLFDLFWFDVFRKKLSIDHRTWAKELTGVRNRWAHRGAKDASDDDTWRALDTMSRLDEQIAPDGAEEIRALLRKFRYGSAEGSMSMTAGNQVPTPAPTKAKPAKETGILDRTLQGLPSWREVIEPHPDVAQGRYKNAEFAADLAQVARGEGSLEYRDPVEFFGRTYVTEGMAGLLVQGLKRVTGKDGEPVIQLKTAFGGGKTHSMLALYHLLRGHLPAEKIPSLHPVLEQAGVSILPSVNVAVLVGTALDPSKAKRPQNFPGITINTLWGEMAAQLAFSAENPKLYDYVKEADKKGVSPGSEAIKNLFDACGPCLVLMDELVAYAKKLYGASGLPAGTFDNFVTFIQEVTEAARASKNSLVVASIPESNIEIGGEAGAQALQAIEHTFGRMESIWKPVAANEGFEVVRRRLFLNCKNPAERDRVCAAFSRMYMENENDFPPEAKELEYRKRLEACYPIHPEVFDRLYEDWATLERFQRTRGVLRLMAAVIHELWMGNDASAMIMPGSLSLDVPNVRDELTRHLDEGWNAIVDREVDGKKSIPYQKDQTIPRYGQQLAARRVARAMFLGSAPTNRSQAVRGIEASRVRLGVVQPGENVSVFNDALTTLQSSLSYLYTNPSGDRYWYDTRPTLRKTVEDRATQVAASDVELEIEKRLKRLRKEEPFAGIHICPASSLDVPDERAVRLVLLRPEDTYHVNADQRNNRAIARAEELLNQRGNSPRMYQNMLAFVAPDKDSLQGLEQETRKYLAWLSVKNDKDILNLDAAQNRETENNLKRSGETVELRLKETYCWLLVPYVDQEFDLKTVLWNPTQIRGGSDNIIAKAAGKMLQNEELISSWAPALLKMELDNLLWKNSGYLTVKQLWEYLCTYAYLPRLSSYQVLEETIRKGVASTEFFALASGKEGERFLNLRYNQNEWQIETSDLLVNVNLAKRQLAADIEAERERQEQLRKEQENGVAGASNPYASGTGKTDEGGVRDSLSTQTGIVPTVPTKPKNTRFFMSAELDTTRIGRDVERLVEEVIRHLDHVDGSHVVVKLDVAVEAPEGISSATVRTVSENCRTLKVKDFGFDD